MWKPPCHEFLTIPSIFQIKLKRPWPVHHRELTMGWHKRCDRCLRYGYVSNIGVSDMRTILWTIYVSTSELVTPPSLNSPGLLGCSLKHLLQSLKLLYIYNHWNCKKQLWWNICHHLSSSVIICHHLSIENVSIGYQPFPHPFHPQRSVPSQTWTGEGIGCVERDVHLSWCFKATKNHQLVGIPKNIAW